MANNFTETTLGRLLSFANGRSSPVRDENLPYPVYGSNGVIGYSTETNASANSIIIGRVGSYCGSLYLAKEPCWVTDNAIRATAIGDNDPRFLFYSLITLDLNHWRSGSGQPLLNQDILSRIPTAVPELEEQRAIAHILGTLDDKIELNRKMNETLEAMAKAIFKSWFVDFDPVRAKAEGKKPVGMDEKTAAFFPKEFQDSVLGEIPRGWRQSKLGNEAETLLGGTPSRTEPSYWGGDIPWINSGKANEFRIIEPSEYITQKGLDSSATKLLPARTTVIAITGATLGQVSITEIKTSANQSIVGVIGSTALPNEFIYFWVRENIDYLLSWQTGGAQQHINKNNVNDMPVLCPSDVVVDAYIIVVRPIFDRIKKCCMESLTLAALRDTLLPKLLSGEIRVKKAEKMVGSVT